MRREWGRDVEGVGYMEVGVVSGQEAEGGQGGCACRGPGMVGMG